MLKTITTAAAVALLAAGSALAAPVTDCKVLAGKALSQEEGAKTLELVLPTKGSGVLDFHFSFAGGHARLGGDTVTLAVCKVGEDENKKAIMTTVYRAKVEDGRATITVAGMPEKGTARVSVVAGKKTYFGTVVAGEHQVLFGDKTPGTSWKEE